MKLYVGKISQLCGHFRFPEEVEATAVTYLKRFYLKNTVMDWHPKNVMCGTRGQSPPSGLLMLDFQAYCRLPGHKDDELSHTVRAAGCDQYSVMADLVMCILGISCRE